MPVTNKIPRGPGGRTSPFGAKVTSDEQAAKQVGSAMDSVALINNLIAAGGYSEQDLKTVSRNVEHLKIVVNRDVVKNSTENLAPLHSAIETGQIFLTSQV